MPINPHGFWASDGRLNLLWAQCWKLSTLSPLQKAIFNTILEQRIFVGDFKNAALKWVDLREKIKGKGRDIEVLGRSDLGLVTDHELKQYLDVLYDAFASYSETTKQKKAAEKPRRSRSRRHLSMVLRQVQPTKRLEPKAVPRGFGSD